MSLLIYEQIKTTKHIFKKKMEVCEELREILMFQQIVQLITQKQL